MKKILLIVSLFFFLAGPLVRAQNSMADTEEELTCLLKDFLEGASVNDTGVHDRFWAEELIYTSSSGQRFGKLEIMQGLEESSRSESDEPPTTYSAEEIRILLYGNGELAIVAFRLVSKSETPGNIKTEYYLNSGTFIKREGVWKAVNWQATKVP